MNSQIIDKLNELKALIEIAPGHNPDKLTLFQVGEGWRLLYENEIKERPGKDNFAESWLRGCDQWSWGTYRGESKSLTYRTRLSREELAALDTPNKDKVVPWDFETAPPELKVRHKVYGHMGAASLYTDGFCVGFCLADRTEDQTFEEFLENYVQLDGLPCGRQLP